MLCSQNYNNKHPYDKYNDNDTINIPLREMCPNTEFSGPYFPAFFSPNAGKYGPEKTLYLDTFHAV